MSSLSRRDLGISILQPLARGLEATKAWRMVAFGVWKKPSSKPLVSSNAVPPLLLTIERHFFEDYLSKGATL